MMKGYRVCKGFLAGYCKAAKNYYLGCVTSLHSTFKGYRAFRLHQGSKYPRTSQVPHGVVTFFDARLSLFANALVK